MISGVRVAGPMAKISVHELMKARRSVDGGYFFSRVAMTECRRSGDL